MTDKAVANVEKKKVSLAAVIADRMSIEPHTLLEMMKDQIITIPDYGNHAYPVKNEELLWVMSVMKELDLTPVVREIHAWRGYDGKLVIHVGYDGWVKCARRDPRYSHVSYECGPIGESPDGRGQPCPEWIAPTIHFRDGGAPATFPPVFLREWYVPAREKKNKPGQFHDGPWQNHTSNRLRQKAFTIAVREVFGFAVLDDVDREWVELSDEPINERVGRETQDTLTSEADRLREKMAGIKRDTEAKEPTVDADFEEMEPAEGASAGDTEVTSPQPGEPPTGKSQPAADDDGAVCYSPGCSTKTEAICEGCGANICPTHSKHGLCTMCKSLGPPDPHK